MKKCMIWLITLATVIICTQAFAQGYAAVQCA